MGKLFKTQEVADIFQVRTETITYWRKAGKLPAKERIPRQSFLYDQQDIITFIINTHLGKYSNSPIDIFFALEKMGLSEEIKLPETKRFSSHSTYYKHIRFQPINNDTPSVDYSPFLISETRQNYVGRISKFTKKDH
jgi:hypothetical protein